jgi:hypothetical protein
MFQSDHVLCSIFNNMMILIKHENPLSPIKISFPLTCLTILSQVVEILNRRQDYDYVE